MIFTVIFTDVCDVFTILQYLLSNLYIGILHIAIIDGEVLVLSFTVDLSLWILLTISVKGLP